MYSGLKSSTKVISVLEFLVCLPLIVEFALFYFIIKDEIRFVLETADLVLGKNTAFAASQRLQQSDLWDPYLT